ncbi:MAG: hypothetical protein AAF591_06895 [Verrucomicrobiota bacterium]
MRGWLLSLLLGVVFLAGCVSTGGPRLDDAEVYRVQDEAFRPMGE